MRRFIGPAIIPMLKAMIGGERRLFCWEATRIGGIPFTAQGMASRLPGRPLCTLNGIASSDVNVFVNIDTYGNLYWRDECT